MLSTKCIKNILKISKMHNIYNTYICITYKYLQNRSLDNHDYKFEMGELLKKELLAVLSSRNY